MIRTRVFLALLAVAAVAACASPTAPAPALRQAVGGAQKSGYIVASSDRDSTSTGNNASDPATITTTP